MTVARGIRALLPIAAVLTFAFTWQGVLATFGDDSASYLTLASYFSGSNPFAAEWAGYHANFPPLFPLLLALSGGADNLLVANGLVAAFAVLALVVVYRYAGLTVAVLFLLTPTAWISLKGVLSESLYLLVSMGSLLYYETRLEARRAGRREWILFGVLIACAYLSRAIGIALIAAYATHMLVRLVTRKEKFSISFLLPLLPVVVLLGLWYVFRPHAGVDNYRRLTESVSGWWLSDPAGMLEAAVQIFFYGWIQSFTADHLVGLAPKLVFGVVGLMAMAGMSMRLARNRLDAWFVIFSLAITFVWTFSPGAARRFLYPLMPLLILYAIEFVAALCARWKVEGSRRTYAMAGIAALPTLLCLPALLMIAERSVDRRPVIAGCAHAYRDVADYYTTLSREGAEQIAQLQVVMLCGLQWIDKITPAEARVMWVRPEYVALLARRPTVAYYYRWTPPEFALEIQRTNTDYVVFTGVYKNDLEGGKGRPIGDVAEGAYARTVFATHGDIFVVMKIDRVALEAFLRNSAASVG